MTLALLTCLKCAHVWLPRTRDGDPLPVKCPECWADWTRPRQYNVQGPSVLASGKRLQQTRVACQNADGRRVSQATLKAGGEHCNACLAKAALRFMRKAAR